MLSAHVAGRVVMKSYLSGKGFSIKQTNQTKKHYEHTRCSELNTEMQMFERMEWCMILDRLAMHDRCESYCSLNNTRFIFMCVNRQSASICIINECVLSDENWLDVYSLIMRNEMKSYSKDDLAS